MFAVRPKITAFSFGEEDNFTPDAHAQTSCIVSEGDLPLDINWTFHGPGGKFLDAVMAGVSIGRFGPRSSVLQIDSLSAAHTGEYTCMARNAAGSHNFTTHLKVLGRFDGSIQNSLHSFSTCQIRSALSRVPCLLVFNASSAI